MLSPRHLARMPSNHRGHEARWRPCGSEFAAAGIPISARYHSIGGVLAGD